MSKFFQKFHFFLTKKFFYHSINYLRKLQYMALGMKVGKNTIIPKIYTTWPHKVYLGNNCILERNVFFKYDGVWSPGIAITIEDNVFIGNSCEFNINDQITIKKYSNISSGCKFIDHNHGFAINKLIGPQISNKKKIVLNEDVWLGVNVVILKGVEIGKGAIVAAGAIVTKNIPNNEIWAGVPARKIGHR